MKQKHFLTFNFMLVVASLCNGFHASGQVFVGPVVGGQACFLSFDNKDNHDLYNLKTYFGFHAGGSISFKVRNDFFLQTSILYSLKGKKMQGKQDELFQQEVTYQYIDVPILFTREVRAKLSKDKFYKLHLGVGPQISYWLGGKGVLGNSDLWENGVNPPEYNMPYQVTFIAEPEEITDEQMNVQIPNRVQLAINFSAGLVLEPDRFNRFMVTAQYSLGHSFLSRDSEGDFGLDGIVYYNDDLHTRFHMLSLSVYYFIDLKTESRNKGKSTSKIKKGRR